MIFRTIFAGGLFLKAKAKVPLSDDVIPEPGIYFNQDDDYYPQIYGILIVFKSDSLVVEVFISAAFHSIQTRRWKDGSWNEWA